MLADGHVRTFNCIQRLSASIESSNRFHPSDTPKCYRNFNTMVPDVRCNWPTLADKHTKQVMTTSGLHKESPRGTHVGYVEVQTAIPAHGETRDDLKPYGRQGDSNGPAEPQIHSPAKKQSSQENTYRMPHDSERNDFTSEGNPRKRKRSPPRARSCSQVCQPWRYISPGRTSGRIEGPNPIHHTALGIP